MQSRVRQLRQSGKSVGVVPTMGALHEGHLSLIAAAQSDCDIVIATIFVNPTQFGPDEDFDNYPRTLNRDLELCQQTGAALVFTPAVDDMYSPDNNTVVAVAGLTQTFEGASRPTHFDGVTTIVAKLFNIALPDKAYFGQKDFQQQLVIRRMTQDLNFPVEIVTCPIFREADGLAMSSRNRYLNPTERQQALALNAALEECEQLASQENLSASELQERLNAALSAAEGVDLDYAAVVDAATLLPVNSSSKDSVAIVAAQVGNTRLIDNRILSSVGH